jgi:peptide/nickel transport system permease protein
VLAFIVRRLLWSVLLLAVITWITFLVFFILPPERAGQRQQALVNANLQQQYDLEGRSLPEQYVHFLGRVVLHGDLGHSIRQPLEVREIIELGLPATLSLVLGGTVVWLLIAFPVGMLSALRPRSLLDKLLMAFVLIGVSAHPVWLGLIFSYVFGVKLHVLPVASYCRLHYDPTFADLCGGPSRWAKHLILPWFTFALLFAALYARMIRANLLESLHEDYVRTARAKGAGTWRVMRRHVLPNTLLPVVTMLGMDVALAFSSAIFIETVFQLHGIGESLYRAATAYDLPVVMGIVLIVSVAVTIANLIVDIVYCLLDPRVRLDTRERRRSPAILRGRLRPHPQVTESPTQAG